jgi:hypothetical protein
MWGDSTGQFFITPLTRMGFFEEKPFLASYYPRFGFDSASHYRIQCEWDVPDTAFMILLLDESEMHESTGLARYLPEFAEAM